MRFASRVVLTLALRAAALAQTQPSAGDYAGSAACSGCHKELYEPFFRNAHYQNNSLERTATPKALAARIPEDRLGCEGCHGPGKAHIQGRGDKSKIIAFSVLSPKQSLDSCLTCHSKNFTRSNIRRSPHTTGEVACTSCHAIHKAQSPKLLLAKSQPELCYGCHVNIRAQFALPFKHRVNEGFMQCTDCHNPHGTFAPTWRMAARPKLVDQSLINEEACFKCHVNQRGPFAFEHAALRVDGCESCHLPHGSANARLMKRPQVFTLCLECHNGVGTFGRDGDGVALPSSSHNMNDPRYQNCTACHIKIHGSNADARFLR